MHVFTLPSGMEVELREMTGAEEEILTNQRLIRTGDAINQVFMNCILRLGESDEISMKDVLDLLSGDRLFILVKLREISLGDEVELDLVCPNGACRALNPTVLSTHDLEVTPYGEAKEYSRTLPQSGSMVRFRHLNGHMEKRLAALKEPSISSAMLMRLIDIENIPPTKKAMNEMSLRDRSYLRQEMLKADAGIDTTIETECASCGTPIRTRLEAEASFLFPGVRL